MKTDKLPTGQVSADNIEILTAEMTETFSAIVSLRKGSAAYGYLRQLLTEVDAQYRTGTSVTALPYLYRRVYFPSITDDDGSDKDEPQTFYCMCRWLTALLLAELRPDAHKEIFSICNSPRAVRDSYVHHYEFHSDPCIARVVASVIYAAVRGRLKPDADAMRQEVGGNRLAMKVHEVVGHTYKPDDPVLLRTLQTIEEAVGFRLPPASLARLFGDLVNGGLFLVEIMPGIAHLILTVINGLVVSPQFCGNRLSDMMNGWTDSAMNSPLVRAASDYDGVLSDAQREIALAN